MIFDGITHAEFEEALDEGKVALARSNIGDA
jgi:hypothetical protein